MVSGGQTGVDRAALDIAMILGIPVGGWCPKGRRAEDGTIPSRYPLTETDSPAYHVRTALNVRDADATLVLTVGPPAGGTALTVQIAAQAGKPVLVVDMDARPRIEDVCAWLQANAVRVLNVAGPRESNGPGMGRRAKSVLQRVLARFGE